MSGTASCPAVACRRASSATKIGLPPVRWYYDSRRDPSDGGGELAPPPVGRGPPAARDRPLRPRDGRKGAVHGRVVLVGADRHQDRDRDAVQAHGEVGHENEVDDALAAAGLP